MEDEFNIQTRLRFLKMRELIDDVSKKTVLDMGVGENAISNGLNIGKLITLDGFKHLKPTIVCDLNKDKIPLKSNAVDTVIAGELIEHMISPVSFLKKCNSVLKIGKFLFVHGGFNEKHLTKSIPEINNIMKRYLNGEKNLYNKDFIDYYMAYNGILWNRELSLGSPDCEKLEKILNHFNVNGLIVGHTVQDSGINSKCNNKIWRVDTGMSQAFGTKQNIQVLEILDNGEPLSSNNNQPFRVLQ